MLTCTLLGAALLLWRPDRVSERLVVLRAHGRVRGAPAPTGSAPRRPGRVGGVLAGCVAGVVALAAGVPWSIAAGSAVAMACGMWADARRRRAVAEERGRRRSAVRRVGDELEAGGTPEAALAAGAAQFWPLPAALIRLAQITGAPIADLLGQVADDLRLLDDRDRAVAVAVAGPRSSAVLLALLPVLGIGLGAAMGAAPWHVLSRVPALACAGIVLDSAGIWWTLRLVSSAVRT